jgi:glycosyltransferase involved in cell wall biosynthesis
MHISAVINGHQEGDWLDLALQSAFLSKAKAIKDHNILVELILVLDSADQFTKEIADRYASQLKVLLCSFKDLSKSRNFGVSESRGETIAFLDGDDAWGQDWLSKSWKLYQSSSSDLRQSIFHPEINWHFGEGLESNLIFRHISSTSDEFDAGVLATQNYWSALSFSAADNFRKFPFKSFGGQDGLGYEDWTFNIETWNAGLEHVAVPETLHFIREKRRGSMKRHSQQNLLTYATKVNFERNGSR